MAQANKRLEEFYEKFRALLKEYNMALDIKAEIVAVDLSALKPSDAKAIKESVGLVGN